MLRGVSSRKLNASQVPFRVPSFIPVDLMKPQKFGVDSCASLCRIFRVVHQAMAVRLASLNRGAETRMHPVHWALRLFGSC
jgi:hypothetical protein